MVTTEQELTRIAESLGIDAGALIRDLADQPVMMRESAAPLIEGVAQTTVWDAAEGRYRPVRRGDPQVAAPTTEARRHKKPAPKTGGLVELREMFKAIGMSDSAATIAAEGRD